MTDHQDTGGLRGLAAIEDFAFARLPIPRGTADHDGLDRVAIEHAYRSSAFIARFMDEHGLTTVMHLRLSTPE